MNRPYFEFVKLTRRLENVKRFCLQPRIHDLSVASHSYYVTLLVYFACVELNELGHKVNTEKAVSFALVHDLPEASTGDIIYPVKELDVKIEGFLGDLETKMFNKDLPEDLPRYFSALLFPALGGTREGEIVELCDLLELVLYTLEECHQGNTYMEPLFVRGLQIGYSLFSQHRFLTSSPFLWDLLIESAREGTTFCNIADKCAGICIDLNQLNGE